MRQLSQIGKMNGPGGNVSLLVNPLDPTLANFVYLGGAG
jgi:hypothetical protein